MVLLPGTQPESMVAILHFDGDGFLSAE